MVEVTEKNVMATSRMNLPTVKKYCQLLNTFSYGVVTLPKELIKQVEYACQEINECLPLSITYFEEVPTYLRKARSTLLVLIQRQKGKESGAPQLDSLFKENLVNINNFFNSFNINSSEETLSNQPLPQTSNDEAKRSLQQRIINPDYDDSREFKATIKEMARTKLTVKEESNDNWRNLALTLKSEYESAPKQNSDVEPISELFLVGVNNLLERERRYKTSEQKSTQLSNTVETLPLSKKAKREALLKQVSNSIVNDAKRSNN
jgi:hypothetical protein